MKGKAWEQLQNEVEQCRACGLCEGRSRAVPGGGNADATVMFVGEGPGAEEDRQGKPFVGAAGILLDKMLQAIKLAREQVYIANVIKCRPPDNRTPADSEAKACLPFLRRQVKLVEPKIIVCLGSVACKYVIDADAKVSQRRGQWIERKGFSILATWHPAALLRNDTLMIDTWRDLKMLEQRLRELETQDAGK